MGAVTDGTDDTKINRCGINTAHAYSILAAFTLTGATSENDVLVIRNPWGKTQYNGKWNYKDGDWTDALVRQVPMGIDPRTSHT